MYIVEYTLKELRHNSDMYVHEMYMYIHVRVHVHETEELQRI
jgi:hypothetical protein